jgi:hypothetical protein
MTKVSIETYESSNTTKVLALMVFEDKNAYA